MNMHNRVCRLVPALLLAMLVAMTLSGCSDDGSSLYPPTLSSLGGPVVVNTPTAFTATGNGFAQGSGSASVRFRATSGTPFAGGTSDEATVTGMVIDNTTIRGMTPVALISGLANIEVSVTNPAGRSSNTINEQMTAPMIWGLGLWGGANYGP